MNNDAEKQAAARASMRFVHDGQIVGLGTGSTAAFAVQMLGERVRAGLKIRGIPTSIHTRAAAVELGIPLTTLDDCQRIDVTIDGADEVDPNLCLIKGGGGAFLREKIVASASEKLVIIADSTKLVNVLGKAPVPVEVIPFAQALVARELANLGAAVKMRVEPSGGIFVTDEGHHVLDCNFGSIADPPALASAIREIPGVVEHGLFIGMANTVLIGKSSGVQELRALAKE